MMLPASELAEIVTNLVGLRLEPTTTAAVLGAVLPPLLRSSDLDPPEDLPRRRASRSRRAAPRARRKKPKHQADDVQNEHSDRNAPRQRAIAALKANPDATLAAVAKIAKCSHGTAINARKELAAEARKQARKEARRKSHEKSKAAQPERRQRAQRFLRDALAHGPKQVSDVEEAAEKAHVDAHSLEQARAELGIVVSRGNAGGVQAVQWSLPAG
jgi:primosomal protein N'